MSKNNVTSRPIKTPKPPRKNPTAIISGELAEAAANHTIRWTSVIFLAASFVGTIMAFNGHWPPTWKAWTPVFWQQVSPLAVIGGCIVQGLCTLFEWGYRKQRTNPKYFAPLGIDIAGTYIGYAPILVPLFAAGFISATLPVSISLVIAHFGVLLISIFAAYYPEQTLVDE